MPSPNHPKQPPAAQPVADDESLATVEPDPPVKPKRRMGFLAGQFSIPDDFNRMGEEGIRRMFEGDDE